MDASEIRERDRVEFRWPLEQLAKACGKEAIRTMRAGLIAIVRRYPKPDRLAFNKILM